VPPSRAVDQVGDEARACIEHAARVDRTDQFPAHAADPSTARCAGVGFLIGRARTIGKTFISGLPISDRIPTILEPWRSIRQLSLLDARRRCHGAAAVDPPAPSDTRLGASRRRPARMCSGLSLLGSICSCRRVRGEIPEKKVAAKFKFRVRRHLFLWKRLAQTRKSNRRDGSPARVSNAAQSQRPSTEASMASGDKLAAHRGGSPR
jgi:hypothetical protein